MTAPATDHDIAVRFYARLVALYPRAHRDQFGPQMQGTFEDIYRHPRSALTISGVVRTPDEDGYVLVLTASASLDLDSELTCDYRNGDGW